MSDYSHNTNPTRPDASPRERYGAEFTGGGWFWGVVGIVAVGVILLLVSFGGGGDGTAPTLQGDSAALGTASTDVESGATALESAVPTDGAVAGTVPAADDSGTTALPADQ